MSWLGGIAGGLGKEGESIERARKQRIIETLNQQAEVRAQRDDALKQRVGEQAIRQNNAPDVQYVKRGNDTYAISRDPNTGKVSAAKVEGVPPEESQEELGLAAVEKAIGRKLSDDEKQRYFKIAPPNPKASKFGSFVPDKDSPTGFSREILDGTTLEPTGRKDYGMPAGGLSTVTTKFQKMTDRDGSEYLVPVTTESHKAGAKNVPSVSAPASTNKNDKTGTTLPKGAISFGAKPISATERRALGDIRQIQGRITQTEALFNRSPDLKEDNSPITPAIDWLEYSKGHFAPSDPVRLKLIQDAAFLSLKGAAPFVTLGRGKYLLEQAQKHLPLPNDSPKLIYDKIQWLKDAAADAEKFTRDPFATDAPPVYGNTPKDKLMQKHGIRP